MAKSTAKVILFSRVTVDKKTLQWPTAVFNDHSGARTYATFLKMAHAAGNKELAVKLDPRTQADAEGTLVPGLKFSIVEAPYSPAPDLGEDGDIETEPAPTS